VKGFRVGAVDYMTKPFNREELLSRVNNHLKIQNYQADIERMSHKRKELLHVLCHDLANPLAAILSAAELIEPNDETESEMVGYIRQSARQGLDVINIVRDIEAAESKEMEMDLQYVILNEALESSFGMLKDKIEKKQISIINLVEPDVVVYVELTTFINSVLNNILTNAVKFSYKGDKIEIGATNTEDDFVVLEIRDNGIGIPDDIIKDLFNSAKATHREGTEGESGTGFGMPLVKTFVRTYGGEIHVKSSTDEKSHGTSVFLKLKRLSKIEK
jgi:signal transduction histidine kinase